RRGPSAQIQGLSGIYALKDVRSWTVYAGSGATRDALATVEWKSGESTITQNYRLTLTQVIAGDSARWQVATLDAATN
ncbi:conjugal transfer protein, partial [Clavibacter michiganensis]|uniref:conjugal transfer protein n=1 Tax=Clavibacter michiganensis TaxID=28447 RepID=UPI000B9F6D62